MHADESDEQMYAVVINVVK
jgi:hypothetical protein